jgi:hypothetical protein
MYCVMENRNRKEEATISYEKLVLPTKIHVVSTRHIANMQSHNKHFSLELKDNKQERGQSRLLKQQKVVY